MKELSKQKPDLRIVDAGAGLATYPKLLRHRLSPDCHFTGIEVWAPYIETFGLHGWYHQLIVADVRYLDWRKIAPSDIALFGDILEHMSRDEAAEVVAAAAGRARAVVLSIPLGWHPQGEEFGNPWETHVSESWQATELTTVFRDVVAVHVHGFIGVAVVCADPANLTGVSAAAAEAAATVHTHRTEIDALDRHQYGPMNAFLDRFEPGAAVAAE